MKKALVIDDYHAIRAEFEKFGDGLFDCPALLTVDPGSTETWNSYRALEEVVRSTPYAVILLDGALGLQYVLDHLESCDGAEIARRIRSGEYGATNQQTPIYNISSGGHNIPGSLSTLRKDHAGIEATVAFIKEKYLKND